MIERGLATGDIYTEEVFNEPAARVDTRYWQVVDPAVDVPSPVYKLALSIKPISLVYEIKRCAKLTDMHPLATPGNVRFLPLDDKDWDNMQPLRVVEK